MLHNVCCIKGSDIVPPKTKTTKEEIIDAAIKIIDEKGYQNLTAREIASILRISTKPIYQNFSSMEDLKIQVLNKAYSIYASFVTQNDDYSALGQSLLYVRFAIEKKNLFNFIFMSRSNKYDSLKHLSRSLIKETKIIENIKGFTGLDENDVYELHLYIWMTLHGIATLASNNDLTITNEELSSFVKNLSMALREFYTRRKANDGSIKS